jgi:cytochrome c-type biogenesis protein
MGDITALSYAVAFAAGVISIGSPCVLALVPGYLSFISGVSFDQLGARTRDVLVPTIAFVVGFSLVFTLYGASAGLIGRSLAQDKETLQLVAGSLLVAMGMGMIALPTLGLLQSDRRISLARRPSTLIGAGVCGGAFAVGWTPCIGPILAAILTIATPTESPALGASLLFTYSLGLGVPFLLAGLFLTRTLGALRRVRDHWTAVNATAAVLVVLAGLLIASGQLEVITRQLSGVGFQGI